VWWRQRFPCGRDRAAAAAEEEADVEVATKETDSSSIDDGGGQSDGDLEIFWDESKMTQGGLLFIGLKISTSVLN
jgi:hypothetical protein